MKTPPNQIDPNRFMTQTLRATRWGIPVSRILAAALAAVDPEQSVRRALRCPAGDGASDRLVVACQDGGEQVYDLQRFEHIWLVGAGKAGAPMAQAAAEVLGDHLTGGVVVVKEGHLDPSAPAIRGVSLVEAGHPVPDQRGQAASREIGQILDAAGPQDLIVCLISGGGSALLTDPVKSISLTDLQSLTGLLLASGATINEINTLRKHLEGLKGGGLARRAYPARLLCLVLSDVIGNPLDVIASGPATPDSSTYAQALTILERYSLREHAPEAILEHLENGARGEIPETPKPGDPIFDQVCLKIVASNREAAQAAVVQAEREGFHSMLLTTFLEGEARQAGDFLAAFLREVDASGCPLPRPTCLVAGGETTVTLLGKGKGGRNQELALGAVRSLAGLPEVALIALATDGGDGPTDAAGAVVSGETLRRAEQAGLEPDRFLKQNDSYHFFDPLGDLLLTGPTRTNVNDLAFLFGF